MCWRGKAVPADGVNLMVSFHGRENGNSWSPGCPQSTRTHAWPSLQEGRAAAGGSCARREQVGSEGNACAPKPAWIPPWVTEAHQDNSLLTHSHEGYCERLGCREGRRRGSYCSFHSCTVPKGSLQGHGAWGQTWQFCQCGPQPQRKMLFSIKIHN